MAKFNVDERQGENFIGLATPACALICGSFAYISQVDTNNIMKVFTETRWLIPVCSGVLSLLLICEIPMFSMKFKNLSWKSNKRRYTFLVVAAPMLALGYIAPVAIISWYLVMSIVLCKKRA